MGLIYGFTMQVNGASSQAYYWANILQGAIDGGGSVTFYPTQTTATYVQIQRAFGAQAPAGTMIASLIVTDANNIIAGTVGVSPAVNVPVTATLYGTGNPIGSVTIPAGSTEMNFHFDVSGQPGLPDVQAFTKQAPQP